MLDVESELDLFRLHYVFIPGINKALVEVTQAYNSHSIRTEHNWSPYRMWVNGMINCRTSCLPGSNMDDDTEHYGIDPDEPGYSSDDDIQLNVSDTLQVEEEIINQLKACFDPLAASNDLGVDIYTRVKAVLNALLNLNN